MVWIGRSVALVRLKLQGRRLQPPGGVALCDRPRSETGFRVFCCSDSWKHTSRAIDWAFELNIPGMAHTRFCLATAVVKRFIWAKIKYMAM